MTWDYVEPEQQIERWLNNIKDHQLKLVEKTEHTESYYMGEDKTGIMSTRIVFTLGKIIIFGDFAPCNDYTGGAISARGYGVEWFSSQLSLSYLGEKFLRKSWRKELAVRDAKWYAQQARKDGDRKKFAFFKAILQAPEDSLDPRYIWELPNCNYDWIEGLGHGYNPRDLAALGTIQRKFAELYAKKVQIVEVVA